MLSQLCQTIPTRINVWPPYSSLLGKSGIREASFTNSQLPEMTMPIVCRYPYPIQSLPCHGPLKVLLRIFCETAFDALQFTSGRSTRSCCLHSSRLSMTLEAIHSDIIKSMSKHSKIGFPPVNPFEKLQVQRVLSTKAPCIVVTGTPGIGELLSRLFPVMCIIYHICREEPILVLYTRLASPCTEVDLPALQERILPHFP